MEAAPSLKLMVYQSTDVFKLTAGNTKFPNFIYVGVFLCCKQFRECINNPTFDINTL